MEGISAQQYPCLEPVGCRLKKTEGWSVVLWVPFQSRGGEIFLLQEISKNTAPHLPWYAAYVILHERKLQIAFIMTYNA